MIKQLYKQIFSEKQRIAIILFFNRLIYPFYLGSTYYCPCCDKSFRTFLTKGNIPRKQAKCPYCGSLERTRALCMYLRENTTIFTEHSKVLHIAPEKALFSLLAASPIEYIDADINPAYARHVVDITHIPYDSSYFDYIICSHVLGHVPDEAKAIQEMKRVLKQTGTAFVMTLINLNSIHTYEDSSVILPADRLAKYGEPDLCRLHGMDFAKRLESQGFAVKMVDFRNDVSKEIHQLYSLGNGERELLFVCTK